MCTEPQESTRRNRFRPSCYSIGTDCVPGVRHGTSLESVAAAVKKFIDDSDRLDLLFLNTGIMGPPAALTSDGYEI
jgi:hypothetical protein